MRVLITGGCGYTGSVLVPKVLRAGHEVVVVDVQWFGNYLKPHPALSFIQSDIRSEIPINTDAVIHLANIANDPAGDLNPKLTWEVNALAMARLAESAQRNGVEQFIYASSGSVYGVSDKPDITETMDLLPLTEYNKSKMVAERVLLSYSHSFNVQIVRPGTVCGVSPRQRLDITVNGMTIGACKGEIKLVGGRQNRPNIHIEDLTDLYIWLLERPLRGIWNAGFENLSGYEICDIVKSQFGSLKVTESDSPDRRSYRMNSDKLLNDGFKPKYCVSEAVQDLMSAYINGSIKDEDACYNLRVMKRLSVV